MRRERWTVRFARITTGRAPEATHEISVNIDCTPEEARRFMGLPDLAPLHDVYIERLRQMMGEGPTPEAAASLMRAWMPMGDAGITAWKALIDQMQGAAKG